MAAGERRLQAVRRFSNRRYWILNGTVDSLLSPTRAAPRSGKGALSVCDVRLFVCPLSVANRTYMKLVRKLTNQSTRKFRTTLRPRNSFTGCSIMTSSQIKDGGRKKSLCCHVSISEKNYPIMLKFGTRNQTVTVIKYE